MRETLSMRPSLVCRLVSKCSSFSPRAARITLRCGGLKYIWTTRRKAMNKSRKHRDELGPDSAGRSGDAQQLPNTASADSESVEELIDEGNAFEADAVLGV